VRSGTARGTVGLLRGEQQRKGDEQPSRQDKTAGQHRQAEKEQQAGAGSKLPRILLTREKQLRTNWLEAILVSPLALPLRAPASPGKAPSAPTEPGSGRAPTAPPVPADCHAPAMSATVPSSGHYHITPRSLRAEGKRSYFLTPRWIGHKFKPEIHILTSKRRLPGAVLDYWKGFTMCFVFSLCNPAFFRPLQRRVTLARVPVPHPAAPQLAITRSCSFSLSVTTYTGSLLPTYSLIQALEKLCFTDLFLSRRFQQEK